MCWFGSRSLKSQKIWRKRQKETQRERERERESEREREKNKRTVSEVLQCQSAVCSATSALIHGATPRRPRRHSPEPSIGKVHATSPTQTKDGARGAKGI